MTFAAGVRFGSYEILSLLGKGGMGEVYKARDTRLQRVVALKILPAESVADADRRARLLLEAQAASRLNHPNIVTIHDIAEEQGIRYIAMEYVAGAPLDRTITGGGLPLRKCDTKAWFTTAIRRVVAVSDSNNPRPSKTCVPTAAK